MKKILILAVATLAASVACTKVETDFSQTPDKAVTFQVASYLNQTKADSHDHTSLIDELGELGITSNYSFQSKAYIHAAQANGTVAAPAAFFNGAANGIETVTYDGTKQWEPAHTYYWPKSAKSSLSFFSWYDFSGANPTVTYSTDGGTATLAWADRTVALKDNVMWADAAYHFKDNTGDIHNLNGVTEGVPTLFHHALAKVRFTAAVTIESEADPKNSGYSTFWVVTLSDVALSSGTIKSNGTLSLTQTSLTTKGVQTWTAPTVWSAPSGTQAYLTANLGNASGDIFDTDIAKGTVKLTTTTANLSGTNFMANNYFTVLPQAVANGVTLTFKYKVVTKYGTTSGGVDAATQISEETIDVTELAPTAPYTATGIQLNAIQNGFANWEINHRYVYNILINPKTATILYDPAVEDWAAEQSVNQTVPAAS